MNAQENTSGSSDSQPPTRAPGLGLSSIELGARRGIGPMSPMAARSWHGESKPCVSCGQLVRRTAMVCDQCGQDMSPQMLTRMARNSGPWYVHEHVKPFPGVSLDRLIRQIERGVLTPTTIVRGPSTYHQWRYAAETPQLSKYLGLCWKCQATVTPEDTRCSSCLALLDGEEDPLLPSLKADSPDGISPDIENASQQTEQTARELKDISQAARHTTSKGSANDQTRLFGIPVFWPILGMIIIMLLILIAVVSLRS